MRPEASDLSDKYPNPIPSSDPYIFLTLTWPTSSIVDVAIVVKDIPGGKIAVLREVQQDPGDQPDVDYLYLFEVISGGNILAPHDQSFPVYHLLGTPQTVEAGFKNQQVASRANAVSV